MGRVTSLLVTQQTNIYLVGSFGWLVGLTQEPQTPEITGDVALWPLLSTQPLRKPGAFHVVGLGTRIGAVLPRSRSRERCTERLQLQSRRGQVPPRTEERGREVKRVSEMSKFKSKQRC